MCCSLVFSDVLIATVSVQNKGGVYSKHLLMQSIMVYYEETPKLSELIYNGLWPVDCSRLKLTCKHDLTCKLARGKPNGAKLKAGAEPASLEKLT